MLARFCRAALDEYLYPIFPYGIRGTTAFMATIPITPAMFNQNTVC
jgi:hypothetical protein